MMVILPFNLKLGDQKWIICLIFGTIVDLLKSSYPIMYSSLSFCYIFCFSKSSEGVSLFL